MVRGLHDRNLMPMITLHHFTDPLWLADMGGWRTQKRRRYSKNTSQSSSQR
jgi:beta-glucosidase